ncbi:MAG: sodium:proton antiporter [Myxococcota bacterium]|jgi:Na+/H+ antiporter NhaD/arsenite permease-like protein|nr:sodium:proton antiporter [Myxococcota bacterium]
MFKKSLVTLWVCLFPQMAWASAEGPLGERVPVWSVVPFALMLLAIAVLPLVAHHWWESNKNRAIVSFGLGIPMAIWMWVLDSHAVLHVLHEYVAFIILLGSLFIISGGIVIRGSLAGTPKVNTIILAIGGLLASFIGTTGASMLLIRPLMRANAKRERQVHIIVFFIFLVSNIGGLLTPLGDPPLFLGFLRGVPFSWTFSLAPQWLFLCSLVLIMFYAVDGYFMKKEDPAALVDDGPKEKLAIAGSLNFLFLGGVVVTILLAGTFKESLFFGFQELGMSLMAVLSLKLTQGGLREENSFSWAPIIEVAVVFAGIFATMIPALAILNARGSELGLTEPWQYFWATGILSSFLDNAPTYLTFTATASGLLGTDAADLSQLLGSEQGVALLKGISLGAVFMGANTYIGNGPNFMVKAIAEEGGVKMPSFFGYLGYSVVFLFPLFALVTFFFLL